MDASLHGNGAICPACEFRREQANQEITGPAVVPCNNCGGVGRVSHGATAICRQSVEWARQHYWPERERLWKIQNEAI